MTITARVSEKASHIEIDGKSYPVAVVRAALAAPVASAAPSGELPPLPDVPAGSHTVVTGHRMINGMRADECEEHDAYSADQMQAYARAAIAHQPPKEALTDEQIQAIATAAYKAGDLSWLGFDKDADDKYTIPTLSKSHYQFARAIIAASAPNKQLVAALNALIEVAERCDSWESFPSDALDAARAALAAAGEVRS